MKELSPGVCRRLQTCGINECRKATCRFRKDEDRERGTSGRTSSWSAQASPRRSLHGAWRSSTRSLRLLLLEAGDRPSGNRTWSFQRMREDDAARLDAVVALKGLRQCASSVLSGRFRPVARRSRRARWRGSWRRPAASSFERAPVSRRSVHAKVSWFTRDEKLRRAFRFHTRFVRGIPFAPSSISAPVLALERDSCTMSLSIVLFGPAAEHPDLRPHMALF